MNNCERKWRDRASWALVVVILFPLTLLFAWLAHNARHERFVSEHKTMLWATVSNQMISGHVIVDGDTGEIIAWNEAATKILGWTEDEVLGSSVLFMMPASYRQRHLGRLGNPVARYRLRQEVLKITCWALTKQSEKVRLSIVVRGVQNSWTNDYHYVMTFDPVASVRELETSTQPNKEEKAVNPKKFMAGNGKEIK